MASCSRVDVENTSIAKTFISWSEKVASERTEFHLQHQIFQWKLAVVGTVTDHPNMEFVIDPTFYGFYKRNVTSLGEGIWKKRSEVVAWLKEQTSNRPFNNGKTLSGESEQVIMDAGDFSAIINAEDAKASLVFPSGYIDAYSIPSTTQIVLKHGGRKFDIKVEHGRLTHGWNSFVTEHDIQYGYVVKFHFRGSMRQKFLIRKGSRGFTHGLNLTIMSGFRCLMLHPKCVGL